jgi:hypothetical protein
MRLPTTIQAGCDSFSRPTMIPCSGEVAMRRAFPFSPLCADEPSTPRARSRNTQDARDPLHQ